MEKCSKGSKVPSAKRYVWFETERFIRKSLKTDLFKNREYQKHAGKCMFNKSEGIASSTVLQLK